MPRLLPLAVLLPLLAALALAQPPMPKKLTEEEKEKLLGELKAANTAAVTAYRAGKTANAQKAFEEGLGLARRLYNADDFPDGHLNLAASLNNLGTVYQASGKRAEAEPLYKDALTMRKRLFKGGDHPTVVSSLRNLGVLYTDLGKPATAEPLLTDALAMLKRLHKGDHPDVANSLSNLGGLYLGLGKRVDAEPLLADALAMLKRLHKGDHPDIAYGQTKLGWLNERLGNPVAAESFLTDALAMLKRLYPEDHPLVASGLTNLGGLYQELERSGDAEPLQKEALAMRKRLFKEDHRDVAASLTSLGNVYLELGKPTAAEPFLREALAMRKRLFPGDHPEVAQDLNGLGGVRLLLGKRADAQPLLTDALAMRKRLIAAVAAYQSEQDQIGHRSALRYYLDSWLTVGDEGRAPERYDEILAWKGSAFARQAQSRAAVLGTNDPLLSKLFAERIDVARQLADVTAATPTASERAEYSKALKRLSDRRDEIDRELTRASEPFRKVKETATLTSDQLAKALPAGVVLVDFLEYTHYVTELDEKGKLKRERRLLAFVVRNGKPVVEVELKASKPIEEAVAAWRQAINRGAGNGGPDDPAAVLRKLVWEPVAKHLGDAKTVLISPDGALGRLPFAALPGSDPKKYLIEEVAIAVVPVPQLIPELLSAKPNNAKPSLLVVGGVDFDADAGVPTAGTDARAAVRGGSAGKWGALAGTSDEATAVANAFAKQFPDGKTTTLTGTGATEGAIRDGITGRRMLHFATHGFFAPPPPEPKEPVGLRMETFDRNRAVGVHPGLQCGLVLAGANKPPKAGTDDGILTALEVAGLDLRGVELAVLSACETGLGKESGGEGVLGLQRAFQVAGAGRVVSSLWKVPDQSTAALMGRFYQHLWADKQPAAEALRRAQLELLRNPDKVAGWATAFRGATADDGKVETTDGRLPPRAWAAFTLSGDWR